MRFDLWPQDVPADITKGLGFPQPVLPDGRWVVMIPSVPSYSPQILPRLWKPLLDGAKDARPRIIRHAYETTLDRLQNWKVMGPAFLEIQSRRTQLIREKGHLPDDLDPLKGFAADWELFDWIGTWASDLAEHPIPHFVPFERACEILAKNTGYTRKTIEADLGKVRRRAHGLPVKPTRTGGKAR
jgi:hypothetical protein